MEVPFRPEAWLDSLPPGGERAQLLQLGYDPATSDIMVVENSDRYAGMRILGKAGHGKSGMIEGLVNEDAENGNAVIVIDPHGDLVDNIIAGLSPACVARTYLLDMTDEEYPFGINIFAHRPFKSSVERTQAVSRITHIFQVLWPDVMDQQSFPTYVRTAILALLANPGTTLMDMDRFLTEKPFRDQMLANIHDEKTLAHWRMHDSLGDAAQFQRIQSILNRLAILFTGNDLVQNIVGQRVNSINWRRMIEEHQIVLIKLPLKQLGVSAQLAGKLIVSQIHATVFSFADLPPGRRPDTSLYIDEFANFSTQDIEELFTEGRKFGIKLTIAHQFTKQVPERMREATETARSQICFQLPHEDALKMAHYFPNAGLELTADDIEDNPVGYLLKRGSSDPMV